MCSLINSDHDNCLHFYQKLWHPCSNFNKFSHVLLQSPTWGLCCFDGSQCSGCTNSGNKNTTFEILEPRSSLWTYRYIFTVSSSSWTERVKVKVNWIRTNILCNAYSSSLYSTAAWSDRFRICYNLKRWALVGCIFLLNIPTTAWNLGL